MTASATQQRRYLTSGTMVIAGSAGAYEAVTQSYVTRILRLAFLSPEVVKSIITGRQPGWLDSGSLSSRDAISLDWDQQKHSFLLGRAS